LLYLDLRMPTCTVRAQPRRVAESARHIDDQSNGVRFYPDLWERDVGPVRCLQLLEWWRREARQVTARISFNSSYLQDERDWRHKPMNPLSLRLRHRTYLLSTGRVHRVYECPSDAGVGPTRLAATHHQRSYPMRVQFPQQH
jgi:hypothetical protein